jgi:thioredoxin reductase (NADPH)
VTPPVIAAHSLPPSTDVLVVGAGPAALFATFQLGLLDLSSCMVDVLPHIGGQVQQLYADKVLYDIPGIRQCSGAELVERLWDQIQPLSPVAALGQMVKSIHQVDGHWQVDTDRGQQTRARALLIASGVGAFAPRRIKAVDFGHLEGRDVHYYRPPTLPTGPLKCAVYGNDEAALTLAIDLSESTEQPVLLCYRRDAFDAPTEVLNTFQTLREQGRIQVQIGMMQGYSKQGDRLIALHLMQPDGQVIKPAVDQLWIMQGISPQVGPIAQWGLALQGRSLAVNPTTFATSEPGIYAIGDAVSYDGKRKLLVSAFHEATQAAYAIADALHPQGTGPQEYTTSSARLQEKLKRL